jgi:nucleoid-associated protein YgaU
LGADYEGLGDAAEAMVSGELDRDSFQQMVESHTENVVDMVSKKASMNAETEGGGSPSGAGGDGSAAGAPTATSGDSDGDGDGPSEEGVGGSREVDGDLAGQFDSLDEATSAVQNGDIDVGTYGDAVEDYSNQMMDQMAGDTDQAVGAAGATDSDAPMSVDGSDGETDGAAGDGLAGEFDSFDAATEAFESGDINAETYGEAASDYTEQVMDQVEAAAEQPVPDSEVGSQYEPTDAGGATDAADVPQSTEGAGGAGASGADDGALTGQFDSMEDVQEAVMDGDIGVETFSQAVTDFNNQVMDRVEAKAEQSTADSVDGGHEGASEAVDDASTEGDGDLAGEFDSLDEATEAMANGDIDAETYGEAVGDYNEQMVEQAMAAAEQPVGDGDEPAAGDTSERADGEPVAGEGDDLAGAFDSIGDAADAAARGDIDAETFGDAVEDHTEQVTNEALGDVEAASGDSDQPMSEGESVDGASDALGVAASEESDGTVDGGDHAAADGDADSVAGRAAANLSNAPVEEAGDADDAEDTGDGEAGVEPSGEPRDGESDPEDGGEGDLNPEKDATGIHMGPASEDPEHVGDSGTEESVDGQGEGGAESDTEGPGEGSHTRTVEAGDTLSSIAEEEYGDPDMWGVIYEANKSQVDGGEAAAEGLGDAELDADSVDSEGATDEEAADAEMEGDTESDSDDVDSGDSGADNLQQAASDAKTGPGSETDGIDDPDLIHPGDELEIPSKEDAEQFDPSEYETPDSFGVGEGPY